MNPNDLITVQQQQHRREITCYQIYGLNIFRENCYYFPELQAMIDFPLIKFIDCLTSFYRILCLVGYPAMENWMNDMHYKGKNASPKTFLGKDTSYVNVSLSFYEGNFLDVHDKGKSLLFELTEKRLLAEIIKTFMGDDAVALFLYEKKNESDILRATDHILKQFTYEDDILAHVLQESIFFFTFKGRKYVSGNSYKQP